MASIVQTTHLHLPDLAEKRRQRGLRVIIGSIFLIQSGFFLIIPLLSVHYVDELGWAATFIGLVLAVRQFTQQGLTLFGGALADSVGAKPLILIGVLVRALSFAVMGMADSHLLLLLSGILAALGGALFDAPIRAMIAAMTRPDEMQSCYAKIGIARNLAQMLGPTVGAVLIAFSFQSVGFGAAIFFLLTFFAIWWGVPQIEVSFQQENVAGSETQNPISRQPFQVGFKRVWTDRPFVLFTILTVGFWFMWVQLSIAFPLMAKQLSGSNSGVGAFLSINSLFAVTMQLPVLWLTKRLLRPQQAIPLGTAIAAIGLGTVAAAHTIYALYGSVFLFSLGIILVMPNVQTVAALMADTAARGAYMGFHALALAVGGGLGNMAGGTLLDLAAHWQQPALPWLIYWVVGMVTACGLWLFQRKQIGTKTIRTL